MAILQIFTPALLFATFAVMLTDFFDTMGTVISVSEQAGFVDQNGRVPGIRNILLVDSAAASVGGLFGASSITTYNISWGIGLGFISFVAIKLFHGQGKNIQPLMWIVSIALLLAFLQTPILGLFEKK